jgi:hypothetical protein
MAIESTPLGDVEVIPFPGRVVKAGDGGRETVRHIQVRLNAVGCGPLEENGIFDTATKRAVKVFQARFGDVTGRPLKIDGEVGSLTWGALFGASSVPSADTAPSPLTEEVLRFAATQVRVMEDPLGSNRGPEVDIYLRSVGLDPASESFPWCVAFTHFCYLKAAERRGVPNPHIKTAGVLDHWRKAGAKPDVRRVNKAEAVADPRLVTPGSLFVIDAGGGKGHSGIVVSVANGRLVTIEGNTNPGGSRNGIGVFHRDARKIADINKGFIDYSAF